MGWYLAHINCSEVVFDALVVERLHGHTILQPNVTEAIVSLVWLRFLDLASLEPAALPGDNDEPSVQRCQRGRFKKDHHVGGFPTHKINM
jgi:hypothetical protein